VPVLAVSSLELLPDVLVPEPVVVAEPELLVVPDRVDDPSEHPDNPIPRLKDMTAAVNKYLWFRIVPPFVDSSRYPRPVNSNQYAIQ
jgi:hypothetical protein